MSYLLPPAPTYTPATRHKAFALDVRVPASLYPQ